MVILFYLISDLRFWYFLEEIRSRIALSDSSHVISDFGGAITMILKGVQIITEKRGGGNAVDVSFVS